jgi:histidine decarboxylase
MEYFHDIEESLRKNLQQFLGYPCNIAYDYSGVTRMFNVNINNVGCPFSESTYKENTKDVEIEVLYYFADLWGINKENIWGYISNGGTEANLQGLYV